MLLPRLLPPTLDNTNGVHEQCVLHRCLSYFQPLLGYSRNPFAPYFVDVTSARQIG